MIVVIFVNNFVITPMSLEGRSDANVTGLIIGVPGWAAVFGGIAAVIHHFSTRKKTKPENHDPS